MIHESKPPLDEALEHFGIKGMHWGVRKDRAPGVSAKTNKEARKDAQDFARAKMFYGEGAGTRRKLIKAKVETKKRHDPNYAKAFDHHLSRQDMGTHAEKARSERKSKDRRSTTAKTSKAIARQVTGEAGNTAAVVAVAATGAAYLNSPKGRRMMNNVFGGGG